VATLSPSNEKSESFLSFDACDQSICNLTFHKFYVDLGLLALPSKARIFCLDSLEKACEHAFEFCLLSHEKEF
jgi:hypothetical protein